MGSSEQRRSSMTTADFLADDTAAGVFDEKTTQEGPTPGACREPPPASPLWAAILADILGVVLRFLPCLTDRAAVRSVCRHWRAAARGHTLPPPLPLLVIPAAGFRFSSFTAGGALTAMAAWRFRMPEEVADDRAHCVGSIEGWLLVARPTTSSQSCEDDEDAGNERFLVNAFSRDSIHLPRLRTPYCSTSGEASWISDDRDNGMSRSLEHVVISAPPDSGTKCIVAGFSYRRTMPGLAEWRYLPGLTLWQPGMKEWYVYQCDSIDWLSDLVFYQGKLYMLHRTNPWLCAVTLGEDEHGVNVSNVEECVAEDEELPGRHHPPHWIPRNNMVVWRGRLLAIVRYINGYTSLLDVEKVEVFALDLNRDPCGITEVNSIDGDCIFVDPCRCYSFPASSHQGVEGDLIYFADKYKKNGTPYFVTTVYSMKDGTMKPFAAEPLSGNFDAPEHKIAGPVWMFPSE